MVIAGRMTSWARRLLIAAVALAVVGAVAPWPMASVALAAPADTKPSDLPKTTKPKDDKNSDKATGNQASASKPNPSRDQGSATDTITGPAPQTNVEDLPTQIDVAQADKATAEAPKGSSLLWQLGAAGLLVLAIGAFAYMWLSRKEQGGASDSGGSSRRRGLDAIQTPFPEGSGSVAESTVIGVNKQIDLRISTLTERVNKLEDQVNRLTKDASRGGQDNRAAAASKQPDAEYGSMVYDRQNAPVSLPEDSDDAFSSPRAAVYNPLSSHSPEAGSYDQSRDARTLVERYNEAGRPSEIEQLARSISAEYYTNERSGDLATLFKSDLDRFWLVPNPRNANEALLIPGFAIRKSWQKHRQFVSDHPLAHHFDLVRGERFTVNRAALLQRDHNGEWQLAVKGEVSGIS